MVRVTAAALAAFCCCSGTAQGDRFEVVRHESVFSVITHRSGVASALAHNHLVCPTEYTVRLSQEADELESLSFQLTFLVEDLAVDVPEMQEKWFPEIRGVGVLDEPFAKVSLKDRNAVRDTMLSEKQLDAEKHPEISGKLISLTEEPSTLGTVQFTHKATIVLTVHGTTLQRDIPARVQRSDDILKVEAVGAFKFTDFGITPYSALFGAVRNKDEFHLYVNFTARKSEHQGSED